jgi:HD-GYP domain-containing protein (c-di-GMP phosphodiesterase class II)
MADFADLKSPYLTGHSSGVAELAAAAAGRYGLSEGDVADVRRAGLLHDLGRVGVSASIWDKPGPLTDGERERVRLHPYYTGRILSRPGPLARLGSVGELHHERTDGSGYHRGLAAPALPPAALLLAAADAYGAMTEPRPHRPALALEEAAEELRREVRAGRMDGGAAEAVLGAAGHRTRPVRRELPMGLTEREAEVLRLVARGLSNRQVAERLYISPKTVGHHVQHVYQKIGVSTRPAATVFAMQHDLLPLLP